MKSEEIIKIRLRSSSILLAVTIGVVLITLFSSINYKNKANKRISELENANDDLVSDVESLENKVINMEENITY